MFVKTVGVTITMNNDINLVYYIINFKPLWEDYFQKKWQIHTLTGLTFEIRKKWYLQTFYIQ